MWLCFIKCFLQETDTVCFVGIFLSLITPNCIIPSLNYQNIPGEGFTEPAASSPLPHYIKWLRSRYYRLPRPQAPLAKTKLLTPLVWSIFEFSTLMVRCGCIDACRQSNVNVIGHVCSRHNKLMLFCDMCA